MRDVICKTCYRMIVAAAITGAAALAGAPGAEAAAARQTAAAAMPAATQAAGAGATEAQPAAQAPVAQPTPLPDVPLVTRDGAAASTLQALPADGRWLLLHVKRGSAPCEALLGRMQGETWTALAPRVAIIVSGASADEVVGMAKAYPALEGAGWYADQPGALAAALELREMPMILAMRQRGIKWTLAGVLSGSKRLQDVLTGWVGTTDPAGKQGPAR